MPSMEVEMIIHIDKIKVGKRFRKDMGSIKELAKSIEEVGLLHPVVINEDNELIAGMRRIEACITLGWEDIPVTQISILDIIKGQCAENTFRKDFLPSEAVAIAKAIRPAVQKDALEREKAGQPSAKSAQGKTRDKVAEQIGYGRTSLQHAEEVVDSGNMDLINQMDKTNKVEGAYRKLRQKTKAEIPPPKGSYDVIVADPPWAYGTEYDTETRRVASPYSEMKEDEIFSFLLDFLNQNERPDCVFWLWTTHKFLPMALEFVENNFEYKLTLGWNKEKMGMGAWLRCQIEFCILGISGKPEWKLTNQRDIIESPRREHSRKPDEFYKMVEDLCPNARRIDLFSRTKRDGWEQWGNEPAKF